ncbi:hypothetical protein SKAU_G00358110 [Synaphobranchus kaupii]|uniref:Uncharacterized protein n=1 Tax=Synaphobranchus kaupii TaxID=118154 RepID=A0A9Q1EHU2_SYNKA|nr:hypothetical protein SKAU_G00358110 [Synaphobranchus kaupii]
MRREAFTAWVFALLERVAQAGAQSIRLQSIRVTYEETRSLLAILALTDKTDGESRPAESRLPGSAPPIRSLTARHLAASSGLQHSAIGWW